MTSNNIERPWRPQGKTQQQQHTQNKAELSPLQIGRWTRTRSDRRSQPCTDDQGLTSEQQEKKNSARQQRVPRAGLPWGPTPDTLQQQFRGSTNVDSQNKNKLTQKTWLQSGLKPTHKSKEQTGQNTSVVTRLAKVDIKPNFEYKQGTRKITIQRIEHDYHDQKGGYWECTNCNLTAGEKEAFSSLCIEGKCRTTPPPLTPSPHRKQQTRESSSKNAALRNNQKHLSVRNFSKIKYRKKPKIQREKSCPSASIAGHLTVETVQRDSSLYGCRRLTPPCK